jgi:hypothetical protein
VTFSDLKQKRFMANSILLPDEPELTEKRKQIQI